jgi:hypothetical protein
MLQADNVVFARNTIINNRMTLSKREDHLTATKHQYVERNTGLIRSQRPFGDWNRQLSVLQETGAAAVDLSALGKPMVLEPARMGQL